MKGSDGGRKFCVHLITCGILNYYYYSCLSWYYSTTISFAMTDHLMVFIKLNFSHKCTVVRGVIREVVNWNQTTSQFFFLLFVLFVLPASSFMRLLPLLEIWDSLWRSSMVSRLLWDCIMSSFLCRPCGKSLLMCNICATLCAPAAESWPPPPYTAGRSHYYVSRSDKNKKSLSYGQLLFAQ